MASAVGVASSSNSQEKTGETSGTQAGMRLPTALAEQRGGIKAAEGLADAESAYTGGKVALRRMDLGGWGGVVGVQACVKLGLGGEAENLAQIEEAQATGAVLLERKGFQRLAAEVAGAEAFCEVVGNVDGHVHDAV
jgi:hypothetical protein